MTSTGSKNVGAVSTITTMDRMVKCCLKWMTQERMEISIQELEYVQLMRKRMSHQIPYSPVYPTNDVLYPGTF